MTKNYYLFLFLLLVFSCMQEPAGEIIPEKEYNADKNAHSIYLSGTANILLDEETARLVEESTVETKSTLFNGSLSEIGVTSMERIFPDAGIYEPRSREMGLHRWYRIHFSDKIRSDEASDIVKAVKGVVTYEPAVRVKMADAPFNDPGFSDQWQYLNDGSKSDRVSGADMQVLPVWRNYTTGNPNVIVAVIDSGVDLNHEDLAANALASRSKNFTNNGTIIPASHGTHVAGSIAAVNNNGKGVSGMAGGDYKKGQPGCKIISCQVFSDNGNGGFETAIKWAADNGAVLCNNSWGYDFKNDDGSIRMDDAIEMYELYQQPNTGEYATALKSAIEYFNKYAGMNQNNEQVGPMAGGVCFFSSGNDNMTYGAPANYSEVVAVGAIGPTGARAYYSNYGDWVDISATGGDYHYEEILSTIPGNNYGYMQGTSMACPHATGAAALIVSYYGSEGFTRNMLLERLLNGTNPIITLNGYGIGKMLDVTAAMTYGENRKPDKVVSASGSALSNTITLSWDVTGSGNLPAAGYYVLSGVNQDAVASATPDIPGNGVRKTVVVSTGYVIGEEISYTYKSLLFETDYYFKIIGFDKNLNLSEESNIINITTPANNPPVITFSESTEGLKIKSFESKHLIFNAEDPDGHSFTISITPGSEAETWTENSAGHNVFIDGSKVDSGTYNAVITAIDSYEGTTIYNLTYTILPNTPPVAVKGIDNIVLKSKTDVAEIPLSGYFNDPDGETVSYDASSSVPTVLHANVSAGTLYLTPIGYGISSVTVYGIDAKGDKASIEFRVLVQDPNGEVCKAYPNPVVNNLYITNGELNVVDTYIKIVSSTGGTVYDNTVKASAFDPAVIDFSNAAPGIYSATISFGSTVHKQTVVKM